MKIKDFEKKIKIPEGLIVEIKDGMITVKNKDKSVTRNLKHMKVSIKSDNENITLNFVKGTKREKTIVGTYTAHIKNMFKGVTEGHTYKLKICSGHFPMNVSVNGNKFSVNNFLGEKTPREIVLKQDVDVKIEGDIITISGINKELTSQTAADLEILTKVKGKDLRIFQDGIYITNKDGKELA